MTKKKTKAAKKRSAGFFKSLAQQAAAASKAKAKALGLAAKKAKKIGKLIKRAARKDARWSFKRWTKKFCCTEGPGGKAYTFWKKGPKATANFNKAKYANNAAGARTFCLSWSKNKGKKAGTVFSAGRCIAGKLPAKKAKGLWGARRKANAAKAKAKFKKAAAKIGVGALAIGSLRKVQRMASAL